MLDSLDAFLTRTPEDRRLTRGVRRHLYSFKGLLLAGPAAAVHAMGLRLIETLPLSGVHLVAIDPVGLRCGHRLSEGLTWEPLGEGGVTPRLRSVLRQDPDVIAITSTTAEDLALVLTAMETGHLVIAGTPAASRAELVTLLSQPGLDLLLKTVPAILELNAQGKLSELWLQSADGWFPSPDTAPPLDPPRRSTFVRTEPPAAHSAQARPSWVPSVEKGVLAPHRMGAASVLLPPGHGWPRCRLCRAPLQHVLQLWGSQLPVPLRRSPDVLQLFLCTQGCLGQVDESDDTAVAGALTLAFPPQPLQETRHPEGDEAAAPLGGGIASFFERAEEPQSDDTDDRPWDCDKLGGWPLWEQGPDWPMHQGQRMELLFQLAESGDRTPGAPARWDDEASVEIPGTPDVPVLDPQRPVHFPDILSGGDGRGFLFRSVRKPTVLRFLWQTS